MGHFSYTCQLTGLPITSGEPVALIPMLPREDFFDNGEDHWRKYGTSNFCSNEGANVFFEEFCFPIFGKYDEYGGVEEIIEDDNTKTLSEYFELSIEDIVEVLCDGRKDEYESDGQFCDSVGILKADNTKHQMLLKMSCTWIHKGVYDKLAKDDSIKEYFDKLDIGVPSVLENIGFKFVKKTEKERYNLEFEKDGLLIYSDGNWLDCGPKEQVYSLFDLKTYCKKHDVDIEIGEFDKKGMYEQIYDCIIPELNNLAGRERWTTERVIRMLLGDAYKIRAGLSGFDDIEYLVDLIKKKDESFDKEESEKLTESIEKFKKKRKDKPVFENFTIFMFDKIKSEGNGFLKSNIVDWHKVKSYYYVTGRYLYPIGTSPQDGDPQKCRIMLQHALDVVNAQIKNRGCDDEDE